MKVEEGEAVGECANCGLVLGDDVALNFPNEPECNNCGAVLERATVASDDVEVSEQHGV